MENEEIAMGKNLPTYVEGLLKGLNGHKIVRRKKIQQISPAWYQELSDRQMKLADQLLEAVRDDFDYRTTDRVRTLLHHLGIKPVPQVKNLEIALSMSRRSDIAFLWFLLRINRNKADILNERILLNCIAHLDMVTTMRGLANVLPAVKNAAPNKRMTKSNEKHIQKYFSPYLEPISQFKPQTIHYHFKHFCKPADLYPYHVWNDPDHVVKNEKFRWFANSSELLSKNAPSSVDEFKENDEQKQYVIEDTFESIRNVLKDHLEILKKDSKYVLPFLPDACDLPILHEFVRQFYGFHHTHKQREVSIYKNRKSLNRFVSKFPSNKIPDRCDIYRGKSIVPYECRRKFDETMKQIKLNFERDFNRKFIDTNRKYWMTLKPFECRPRLRESFFSYFPACETEGFLTSK